MSRKAKTLSLSKSFIEGMSPAEVDGHVSQCLDMFSSRNGNVPLMILQKMHAAAMVGDV